MLFLGKTQQTNKANDRSKEFREFCDANKQKCDDELQLGMRKEFESLKKRM